MLKYLNGLLTALGQMLNGLLIALGQMQGGRMTRP